MTTRRDLYALARAEGWSVERTRGDHLRLRHPLARGYLIVSSTPSCPRALANIKADMRRLLRPAPELSPPEPADHE